MWFVGLPTGLYLNFIRRPTLNLEGVWIGLNTGITLQAIVLFFMVFQINWNVQSRLCQLRHNEYDNIRQAAGLDSLGRTHGGMHAESGHIETQSTVSQVKKEEDAYYSDEDDEAIEEHAAFHNRSVPNQAIDKFPLLSNRYLRHGRDDSPSESNDSIRSNQILKNNLISYILNPIEAIFNIRDDDLLYGIDYETSMNIIGHPNTISSSLDTLWNNAGAHAITGSDVEIDELELELILSLESIKPTN
jgi:hypothetical protein